MKRLLCVIFAGCLLCVTAFADIAWEPENSFYARNQRKCTPEERVYWLNGPEGFVTVLEEPEGKPLGNLKNGALRYVYGTYERDGVRWGLINVSKDRELELFLSVSEEMTDGWNEVWVPMEELVLRYDHQSFLEDHVGEVQEVEQEVDFSGLLYCKYHYPGGELDYQQTGRFDHKIGMSLLYTDESGRDWGYTYYFQGDNGWFCLSDPENPNLQAEDRTPELIPAAENAELPAWTASPNHTILYVTIGVVAVCGVTMVLLLQMKKKKRG